MSFLETLSALGRYGAVGVEERFEELKAGLARRLGTESGELHLQAYRGYGTRERFRLVARALRGAPLDAATGDESLWDNILDAYRRFESDEIPGARVAAEFGTIRRTRPTDAEGYLHLELEVPPSQVGSERWQEVALTVEDPADRTRTARTTADVLLPGDEAEYGVVSDIDDTVLVTGATDLLSMARLTFLHNARTRLPFEGVGGLYRALEAGSDGGRTNPFFYVSSSPWNLYDLLDDFFRHHDLPRGVFLLRDLGLTRERWFSGGHDHKRRKIEDILALYPHLPFVLVGDSGQKDPEIYARVAAEHPGRIRAIYIRDVTDPPRDAAVAALAERTRAAGTPMLVVRDSRVAAGDAVERGLIPPEAVDEVEVAHELDERRPTPAEALIPGGE